MPGALDPFTRVNIADVQTFHATSMGPDVSGDDNKTRNESEVLYTPPSVASVLSALVDVRTGAVRLGGAGASVGSNAISIGQGAIAGEENTIAIGTQALAAQKDAMYIGSRSNLLAQSNGLASIAIGKNVAATKDYVVSIGAFSSVYSISGVAIGTVASVQASYGIAIGRESLIDIPSLNGIAIGYQAVVGAQNGIAIGQSTVIGPTASEGLAIGFNATCNGVNGIAIGNGAFTAFASVAIGAGGGTDTTTANGQVVFGGSQALTDLFLGKGVLNGSPVAVSVNPGGGSGTNITGAALHLNGGKATGSANGGAVIIRTSVVGGSGTTLQALADRVKVDNLGNVVLSMGGALGTGATDGFTYLPSMAGTPSGTPTGFSGAVPVVIDTTGSKLWAYIGGAWKSTVLA